ncbi:hypothetical protein CGS54_06320 [Faecalibacterium prausnitzii]|nr:hypothetical protein CGS54_06320 [Faecalibacterium prausnitzii]
MHKGIAQNQKPGTLSEPFWPRKDSGFCAICWRRSVLLPRLRRGHAVRVLYRPPKLFNSCEFPKRFCWGVRSHKPCFIISIMTDQRLIYSNCQSLQVH